MSTMAGTAKSPGRRNSKTLEVAETSKTRSSPRVSKTPAASKPKKSLKASVASKAHKACGSPQFCGTIRGRKMSRTSLLARKNSVMMKGSRTPRCTVKSSSVAEMVLTAVEAMNDRRGSSFHAIKRYLDNNSQVDGNKIASQAKKFLWKAVEDGSLVKVAGSGTNGTYRLPGRGGLTRK